MPAFHIIVCGSVVPDPLQTILPNEGSGQPGLKNEMMLPHVLDPWVEHALYEAANLQKNNPGSKVWLVSLGPKAKLQQVMMKIAQKVPFDLVAMDGPSSGFTDSFQVAQALAQAIEGIAGLDKDQLLLFGGWESASRASGTTMQICAEMLGIEQQFQGVDACTVQDDGSLEILERIEGGRHQVSHCRALPACLGWATGNLPEPPNNPQIGMTNMRTLMPSLQKAQPAQIKETDLKFKSIDTPKQRRETRVVRDLPPEKIAQELATWIRE